MKPIMASFYFKIIFFIFTFIFASGIINAYLLERCPSGLRCKPGTFVWGQLHRGFESPPLRILQGILRFYPAKFEVVMINEVFDKIIKRFTEFPAVQAVAAGGSTSVNTSDESSDIDIYVFTNGQIPLRERIELIKKYSSKYETGCEYFGPGDEFFVDKMNRQLDVMYFGTKQMEDNVENIWEKHYPSNGYTTCFLFTLKNCKTIYDKNNWLADLKNKLNTRYPAELKQNIIKRNLMLLKDKPFASYYEQIQKALKRNDINSVNHRISAFMASYFDIIFALNELLHPGEKKLINYALKNCKILPENFEYNIVKLLAESNTDKLKILDDMIAELKKCL